MSTNTQYIVQKLWNYCNILRDDGMSYSEDADEQGLTPPSIPAHLDEEPTYALQWKGVPFTSDEVQVIDALLHL